MAIIRNKNKENYTIIDNEILKNKNLSLKARGMLLTLLSLPDNWEFSENGLEILFCDGITAIKSSLKELEENGYLIREKYKNGKGQFSTKWTILENPQQKTHDGKSATENDTQLNTKIKYLNNNICPSKDEQDKSSFEGKEKDNLSEEQLSKDFNLIWKDYPRKDNKNTAYKHYKSWLKGKMYVGSVEKLENKEMWYAVQIYRYELMEEKKEKQYIKMGSTFFNEAIFEYATKYKENSVYWKKKIDDWRGK